MVFRDFIIRIVLIVYLSLYFICCGSPSEPGHMGCTGKSPIWTTTSDYSSVCSCVTSASPGDTINVSAGSATWSRAIEISKPLTIIGAGYGAGGTLIRLSSTSTDGAGFNIHGFDSETAKVRISGFKFTASAGAYSVFSAINIYNISGKLWNLRIDNNYFDQFNRSIKLNGNIRGVIDSNYIYNCNLCIEFGSERTGDTCPGDASWSDSEAFLAGRSSALFIEDNHFVMNNSQYDIGNERIGTFGGGKLVVRWNTFDSSAYTDPTISTIAFMSHGNNGGYWSQHNSNCARAETLTEIYNNTIYAYRMDHPIILRGASNIVYSNDMNVSYSPTAEIYAIVFQEEECYSEGWSPLRSAWPAEDQVHNTFLWDNALNGTTITDVYKWPSDGSCDQFFVKDQDYFMHIPAASGGSESYTSRLGAAGTYPTDGNYYDNTGTMTFSSSGANAYYPYTSYPYPHPLRSITQ